MNAMASQGFFRRWSRLKAGVDTEVVPPAAPQPMLEPLSQSAQHPPIRLDRPPATPARPLPTLDDVARLGPDSDFSAFLTEGIDKSVQRLAMKKLFTDPHFRVGDGLDVYIDDYTGADPVSEAMLASLSHAARTLGRTLADEPPPGAPDQPPKDKPGGTAPPAPESDA
jgi:hypothetical protein